MQPLKKFRPQDFVVDRRSWVIQKKYGYLMRSPLTYRQQGYNWHVRESTITDPLARIHSRIHYLTAHAPKKVQQQWETARKLWKKRTIWHKAGINDRL